MKLTKAADVILHKLYAEYLTRCESGVDHEKAAYFGGDRWIQTNFFPSWSVESVRQACLYLDSKGFVSVYLGDDMVCDLALTLDGIEWMENRYGRKIKAVLDSLEKLAGVKNLFR